MFKKALEKKQKKYDLTQSQMSIWTGQMLSPQSPLYNMIYVFDLYGEIDSEHFKKAFQSLVDKSDALRTVFDESKNNPRQIILPKIDYELEYIDFSEKKYREETLSKWIENRSRKKLNLSKCTFDSALIKISQKHFVWFFNEHHLTTDARSSSIIFKKMAELYEMSLAGKIEEVSSFPRYQDFIKHEKESYKLLSRKAISEYWQTKNKEVLSPPRLYGRSNIEATTKSKRVILDLGIERSRALKDLTNEENLRAITKDLSLFNIFTTVLFSYLYRVSGQNHLIIGTPVHNRTSLDFRETPGLFIEFFPFACEVKKDDTFQTLFKRISKETINLLRNAQIGASTPENNRSFNVVLNYIDTDFPDFNGIPCNARWIHPNHSDISHHLRLHVYNNKRSDNLQLYFDFNCGVFDGFDLETVSSHFLEILDTFIESRMRTIDECSLINKTEFQKLVVDFNKQTDVQHKNVLELFQIQVKQHPKSIVISDETQNISYEELDRRSNRVANFLISKEVAKGKRVAIYLHRSIDLIVGILGTIKAGCAYIPIAPNNPFNRVVEKAEIADVSIVLTHRNLDENLQDLHLPILRLDGDWKTIEEQNSSNPNQAIDSEELAYIMFTSGSTGKPKGVQISHGALSNYINFAGRKYNNIKKSSFPLFTTIDFDLTITSIFVPLTTGGSILIYKEYETGPDLAILDVIKDNKADIIKLTPSHLSLVKGRDLSDSKIKTIIVGGEDFRTDLAKNIKESFHDNLTIYNEYGPTESTVGCILHTFNHETDISRSVPIGKPFANTQVYILDEKYHPVPQGVVGKLYLSGKSLSDGYWENPELTKRKFVPNPFISGTKMYDTGDLVRLNRKGELEYLGRVDQQVKVGGIRVELGEIESALRNHSDIQDCVVELIEVENNYYEGQIINCIRCGLPSNYPTAEFDKNGLCNLCLSFENYQKNAQKYFKTPDDLQRIFKKAKDNKRGKYDCLMLLSGGKDSTYALGQLVQMDINILAFTLDNGYISEQAKANIKRVVNDLGVDHIFARTPAMNEIFVDSLERHSNVCNGCFKTIYTLSMQVALEKQIPFIVTGLSRGQFFETRLTEELFWKDDVETIDQIILDARKAYHQVNDAVKKLLDTSIFNKDSVFEKVQFIDFYRYFDVEFEEMMEYLDERLPWIRPTDTGRSTNCLINQLGIYIHKKEKGFSNYAFPYSWDVRMGHKSRSVSLNEINEEIDENEVKRMMREIGLSSKNGKNEKQLVAYYVSSKEVSYANLRNHLKKYLPDYMIPNKFKHLESLPLTDNGKIDRKILHGLTYVLDSKKTDYIAPDSEIEEILADIWSEVLQINKIGIYDDFLELGGNSLSAIRIMTRLNDKVDLELPLNLVFENPTISQLSKKIEKTISKMLAELEA